MFYSYLQFDWDNNQILPDVVFNARIRPSENQNVASHMAIDRQFIEAAKLKFLTKKQKTH